MTLYTGQKIPISTTITDKDGIVDLSTATVVFSYWVPVNKTATPTDAVAGTITSAINGTVTGEITATVNVHEGKWRIQPLVTIGADVWPAVSSTFVVRERGYVG